MVTGCCCRTNTTSETNSCNGDFRRSRRRCEGVESGQGAYAPRSTRRYNRHVSIAGRSVMDIPVLIEPVAGNGYRAKCGEPLPISAEGRTRDEALANLRRLVEQRVAAGAEV